MKSNKIIIAAALVGSILGTTTSCSDSFLEENLITERSTDYFKTQDGLDDLVTGAYQKLKFKFNYVWAINCYNMGVDEFTGGNNDIKAYNHYSSDLNSTETTSNQPVWDNMYGLVEPANILIQNIPQYYDQSSATYNTRLGEAYFLRAYGYFELVKQFGGVPIKLTPSTSVETYFTRNSEEECYAQIISDFETAYGLLPTTGEATGRITKSACAHFLAKAHLFRASELYSSWNSSYVSADLDAVIKYGKEVIEAHPLCTNFQELWDYTAANSANESVDEVVLAAQFSDDSSTWGRYGNQMHLYYPSVYQNLSGTKRDISGDREFCYVSATEYSMQVFDRVNDSRFWKSFITKYGCNDPSNAPTWEAYSSYADKLPDGVNVTDKRFTGGEIGIKYIVNNPGDDRFEDIDGNKSYDGVLKNGKLVNTHTFVRYYKGETFNWNVSSNTGNYYNIYPHLRSVALSKFRDGYRIAIASQFGTRDAIIARSADDVLMVAEAYIRKGESYYGDAITYLNMVRDRAAYVEGEDRSKSVDGGQAYKNNSYCVGKGGGYSDAGAIYTDENTYYESNNIEETTASTLSAMHLNSVDDVYNSEADTPIYNALGCTTNAEKMMCFLLNERTRELIGESHRWEDLARTKTLEARWNAFNDGYAKGFGKFDASKHYYRPIPQSFLDGITNESGASLSDEEKAAMQNPGY
ncbi:MAG: RagB/SusD family nutrient uptake outer membrane protein [Prevotellaceae bacterium]|nr:RagB/SusD family nutrient uptake outer membrane protein [Prevotellaceae bacterium]